MTILPITSEDVPVVVVKLDKNGTIVYVNKKIESMMGYSCEKVIGQNFFDAFNLEGEQTDYGFLMNTDGENAVNIEHALQTPDGVDKYFCWQIYGAAGEEKVAFGFDMTHCKTKADQIMMAMSQAEIASQAKTDFIANTNHELRTPLNAVIGYSEMLLDEIAEKDIVEIKHDLEKINSAAKHLLSVVTSVLEQTKREAEQMEV